MKSTCIMAGLMVAVFGLFPLRASTQDEVAFHRANTTFLERKYPEATREYEALAVQKPFSASLLYNLANTYYHQRKIGPAILNYERALWLDPRDPDIGANLRFVRNASGLFEPARTLWQQVTAHLTLNMWTGVSLVCLVLFCASLMVRILKLDGKWSARPLVLVSALALILTVLATAMRAAELCRGVVVAADAPLRVAPLDSSPSSFNLTAGSTVRIEKQRKPFLFIHTEDGRAGWVSDEQVKYVVPRI